MSLVETWMSVVLMAWLSAMSLSATRAALVHARLQEARRECQQNANLAIDMFAREVRLAGFSAAGERISAVSAASSQRIEVVADLNGDGDTDDANERVAYSYDADKKAMMRATGGASPQPFVRHVAERGFQLTYTDRGGQGLGALNALTPEQRAQISQVVLELHLDLAYRAPNSQPAAPLRLRLAVALRNP